MLLRIKSIEDRAHQLSDGDLRTEALSLRYRAKCGTAISELLPRTYALVREAAARHLEMRHFDSQMLGGILLAQSFAVEMATGEGKTLTATLPLCLRALEGKGAHLVTANDYLALRDAEWMRPVYESLGLTVAAIQSSSSRQERRQAYACDITYGSAKEFGFDFLRDRLTLRQTASQQWPRQTGFEDLQIVGAFDGSIQRGLHFALIDEADSVLIDEARTPLVIGRSDGHHPEQAAACFVWAAQTAKLLQQPMHYALEVRSKTVSLSMEGQQAVRGRAKSPALDGFRLTELYSAVERALLVTHFLLRDRHYVVRDGEVVIVDELTGRLGEGRKWRGGIHQAIEAAENIQITANNEFAAQIAVQQFFRLYDHLTGMSGTLRQSSRELSGVYRLPVVSAPTHRPCRRLTLPDLILATAEQKWAAIVKEVKSVHASGRPVLVGTRSIENSEHLSQLLDAAGIPHQVLNARHTASEAKRVACAGRQRYVTVATNMAGRGTDIILEAGVAELGGLHVICTEMHETARVDRQLAGRAARQGDPGSVRRFLALDDEIISAAFGPNEANRLQYSAVNDSAVIERRAEVFRVAQSIVARRHARQRRALLKMVRKRDKRLHRLGLDPFLDVVDDPVN
jgi:preprotein translocase subunit SecA